MQQLARRKILPFSKRLKACGRASLLNQFPARTRNAATPGMRYGAAHSKREFLDLGVSPILHAGDILSISIWPRNIGSHCGMSIYFAVRRRRYSLGRFAINRVLTRPMKAARWMCPRHCCRFLPPQVLVEFRIAHLFSNCLHAHCNHLDSLSF